MPEPTYKVTVTTDSAEGVSRRRIRNVPETEIQNVRADARWKAPRGAVQTFTETRR